MLTRRCILLPCAHSQEEAAILALTKRELTAKAKAMGAPLRSGPMTKTALVDVVLAATRAGAGALLAAPSDVFARIVPYLES